MSLFSRDIDVESLRADIWDDPQWTSEQRDALLHLPDEVLSDALEAAFEPYEDYWLMVLDNTHSDAARALYAQHLKREGSL